MQFFNSLVFRVTSLYIGIFWASVLLLAGMFYWATVHQPRDLLMDMAAEEFASLNAIHAQQGSLALAKSLEQQMSTANGRERFHALIDPTGKTVSANLPSWPSRRTGHWLEIEADRFSNGTEIDHYAILRDGILTDGSRLLIGYDGENIYAAQELLRAAVGWLIGGGLMLSLTGAWLMAMAIRKRVDLISRSTRKIMMGDLNVRVPLTTNNDELDQLSYTINAMLTRIEKLFADIKHGSDHAAHELRTPLTRLAGHLDRARSAGLSEDGEAIDAAVLEVERLGKILDTILRISRIESGRFEASFRSLDLGEILREAAEFYAPEVERKGMKIVMRAGDSAVIQGDPDLVFQAACNLIDNAAKFGDVGGKIELGVENKPEGCLVTIRDFGPGLGPGEASRVTQRFFRGNAALDKPGSGLGLAVVAAIAASHGAAIAFRNAEPGLAVEILWPSRGTPAHGYWPVTAELN
jgi:signal transduction histidine kinase